MLLLAGCVCGLPEPATEQAAEPRGAGPEAPAAVRPLLQAWRRVDPAMGLKAHRLGP